MITAAALIATGIPAAQAQAFEAPLQAACARYGIDTPARMAAFVAQCAHESRNFTALEEGLFYRSADRIRAIFPSRVPSLAAAQALVGNPEALADCVYAGRNGNGDEASGDGYRYRGRGLIQLTGRGNYERAAGALARDYLATPDLVAAAEDACLTAGWFWDTGNLNALADAGRFDAITRAVNGSAMAGAAERRELYEQALKAFTPEPAPATRGAAVSVQVPAPQAAAKKTAPPPKPATGAKRATKEAPSRKKQAATKKATSTKRTSPTKRAATKRAGTKSATATKRPAAPKRAAPAKRATSAKRAASAKPATASRKTPARKATAPAAKPRAPAARHRAAKPVRA
jgi:putative chitinase